MDDDRRTGRDRTAETARAMTTANVGRQPILNRRREIVGYELLYRATATSRRADEFVAPLGPDGDQMTDTVIFGALGIGVMQLTGGKELFCNADRAILTGRAPISLPPRQTVVEILETVEIDDEVLAGCRALKRAGYRLAADDFIWSGRDETLLELVDIVKIDLQATPQDELADVVAACREFDLQLLAEKVETEQQWEECLELGFDLFQGYLLGRPETISGPTTGPSRHGVLALSTAVLDDDVNYARLEEILRPEPELVYQLVQLASQGRLGETRREVRSLRQALVLVGLNRVRGWIPTLLLRPAGPSADTNMTVVLARARMAELLADKYLTGTADLAFTAGMFSAFDLLLGVPTSRLPELLGIPSRLCSAAFDRDDPVGQLVGWVADFQRDGSLPPADSGIEKVELDYAASCAFAWAARQTNIVDNRDPDEPPSDSEQLPTGPERRPSGASLRYAHRVPSDGRSPAATMHRWGSGRSAH
jgi:EAL and modified HD-GYP domain-containing signal transduction protein